MPSGLVVDRSSPSSRTACHRFPYESQGRQPLDDRTASIGSQTVLEISILMLACDRGLHDLLRLGIEDDVDHDGFLAPYAIRPCAIGYGG
jgi:hypothetical protein